VANKVPDSSARYVDLSGGGEKKEALIYLTGDGWCGSGGCTLLIVKQTDAGFKIVSRIPATRTPIMLLKSKSHGWRNIGVFLQGGRLVEGYEAELRFNGAKYRYPPMPPRVSHRERVTAEIVFGSSLQGEPLRSQ